MSNRNLELIDQITNLVVQAIEPHRMLDQILSTAINLARAQRGAIFAFPEKKEIQLLCSHGADQSMIAAARGIYKMIGEGKFLPGEIVYCPDVLFDMRFNEIAEETFTGIRSFACIPILTQQTENEKVSGVLYVDSQTSSNLCSSNDLEILQKFARILEKSIIDGQQVKSVMLASNRTPESLRAVHSDRLALPAYLERQRVEARLKEYLLEKSIEEIEREKLVLLMEKTRGNITRVAQQMKMQRRTIYLKLKKYGIQRTRGKGRPPSWEPAYE